MSLREDRKKVGSTDKSHLTNEVTDASKSTSPMREVEDIAKEILALSRNTLLINLRFLDMAISMLTWVPVSNLGRPLATDGQYLFFNPRKVITEYKIENSSLTRDYLHFIFHCIFQHPFVCDQITQSNWNLACDIAVEHAISELGLKQLYCLREVRQQNLIDDFMSNIPAFTAEKIYRYLLEKGLSKDEIERVREPFMGDDHRTWWSRISSEDNSNIQENQTSSPLLQKPFWNSPSTSFDKSQNENSYSNSSRNKTDMVDNLIKRNHRGPSFSNKEPFMAPSSIIDSDSLGKSWQKISLRAQTDLETYSQKWGPTAGGLMQSLDEVTKEKFNYEEFLRQFTVFGEELSLDEDEFDYIFYTYGLTLCNRMPFIEPLEYKEVKRIQELVIAIDTSGSCSGEVVQKFLQKTYNILLTQESFHKKFNVHIIQCDAKIQEDVKITNRAELDDYLINLNIKGLGGTDFRPVFQRVEAMRKMGEFTNLKGLIYFTDGEGTFPKTKTDYKTAFVFLEDGLGSKNVPPWACKIFLNPEDI